jgi:hypothetical protein
MPPRYYLEGVSGDAGGGRTAIFYYWVFEPRGSRLFDFETGDERRTMDAACKEAWRHYRSEQTAKETKE